MFNLENEYFRTDFAYQTKLVNKYIIIAKFSKDSKRVSAYKNLIFKMMKDIVKKNIANYLNLMRNSPDKDNIPSRSELVADCYLIFDKCLEKFQVGKGYNFYFYFNKSLSRNFFRDYQKNIKKTNNFVPVTDNMCNSKKFRVEDSIDYSEMLMENFHFNELEKRICRSRMLGQKISEFLEANTDVTSVMYSKALKNIKEVIKTSEIYGNL